METMLSAKLIIVAACFLLIIPVVLMGGLNKLSIYYSRNIKRTTAQIIAILVAFIWIVGTICAGIFGIVLVIMPFISPELWYHSVLVVKYINVLLPVTIVITIHTVLTIHKEINHGLF